MAFILVVDDNPPIHDALVAALEARGHEALVLDNGKTALDLLSGLAPDVVLLDLFMPTMDGIQCLMRMRDENMQAKVIIMVEDTPYVLLEWADLVKTALLLGASTSLTKPFTIDQALACLRLVLADI